jgi:glycosyltransferase involved in cell wall biosynthesis
MRKLARHIVHTHSYVLRYAWPARMLSGGGPIVHTVHNLADRELDRFGRGLHSVAMRRGVPPSPSARRSLALFAKSTTPSRAPSFPIGADLEASHADWRSANGFAPGDLLIVSVARLDAQKNPLLLIDAFTRAFADDPRCHLLLAGSGTLAREAPRVHYLGVRQRYSGPARRRRHLRPCLRLRGPAGGGHRSHGGWPADRRDGLSAVSRS